MTRSQRIARWDEASWSAVGHGFNNTVYALASFDGWGGPALYAGGDFTMSGPTITSRLARWDGGGWSSAGPANDAPIRTMCFFGHGPSASLIVTGLAGGGVHSLWRLHEGGWSGPGLDGGRLNGSVDAVAVFDDGTGERLYVGGPFTSVEPQPFDRWTTSGIARWQTRPAPACPRT